MWRVEISWYGSPLTVTIAGCPRQGIEAIDFRKAAGLPEAPSNRVELPPFAWEDEPFVRANANRAGDAANISLSGKAGYVGHWVYLVCEGDVQKGEAAHVNGNADFTAGAIRDYLKEQTPETGRALLLDLWDYPERSKAAALAQKARREAELEEKHQAEARRREEVRLAEALLDDTLKALRYEVAYWKREAESARKELAGSEGEDAGEKSE